MSFSTLPMEVVDMICSYIHQLHDDADIEEKFESSRPKPQTDLYRLRLVNRAMNAGITRHAYRLTRASMRPSQITRLASLSEVPFAASVRELDLRCDRAIPLGLHTIRQMARLASAPAGVVHNSLIKFRNLQSLALSQASGPLDIFRVDYHYVEAWFTALEIVRYSQLTELVISYRGLLDKLNRRIAANQEKQNEGHLLANFRTLRRLRLDGKRTRVTDRGMPPLDPVIFTTLSSYISHVPSLSLKGFQVVTEEVSDAFLARWSYIPGLGIFNSSLQDLELKRVVISAKALCTIFERNGKSLQRLTLNGLTLRTGNYSQVFTTMASACSELTSFKARDCHYDWDLQRETDFMSALRSHNQDQDAFQKAVHKVDENRLRAGLDKMHDSSKRAGMWWCKCGGVAGALTETSKEAWETTCTA